MFDMENYDSSTGISSLLRYYSVLLFSLAQVSKGVFGRKKSITKQAKCFGNIKKVYIKLHHVSLCLSSTILFMNAGNNSAGHFNSMCQISFKQKKPQKTKKQLQGKKGGGKPVFKEWVCQTYNLAILCEPGHGCAQEAWCRSSFITEIT